MGLELTGKIKLIKDVMTFDSGFQKREFVITTQEQYPQDVQFELVQDKTSLIDKFSVGDELMVHFNVRGREYQGRHFVNLTAWRLEAMTPTKQSMGNDAPLPDSPSPADVDEDVLPF